METPERADWGGSGARGCALEDVVGVGASAHVLANQVDAAYRGDRDLARHSGHGARQALLSNGLV